MVWRIMTAVLVLAVAIGLVVERAVTDIQIRTIADVQKNSIDKGAIAVKGTIAYAEENKFILDDGTGRAELATCPIWYKRINLHVKDEVIVVGEMLQTPPIMNNCDITLSVMKVFRGDETIVVRGRPGKPPWVDQRGSAGSPGY